ncbi:hypothetical protein HMPREF1980_00778 [Actinomyces sp. oral taxon 172 str. F0311]|nr:hypothetical protein HMPREF1980_00778 [Actinomyces sp. oral taxon 172 str. F0311]
MGRIGAAGARAGAKITIGQVPRYAAPSSSLLPHRSPQKSHAIWVPYLFLGIEKPAEFQRSDFKP